MTWAAGGLTMLMAVSGLLPFVTGTLLARVSGCPLRLAVFALGLAAAAALVGAGLAGREAWAKEGGRWPRLGYYPPEKWRCLAYVLLGGAAVLGMFLQYGLGTGVMTLPLGALVVLGGYFTFASPLAWHRRGAGEAACALCFGLLPVLTGYYLQCGHLVSEILILGLPLSFAAFNLFLVHGFPQATKGPATPFGLAGRLTPAGAGLVYTIANILTIVGLVFYLLFPANPLPGRPAAWLAVALALVGQELVKRRAYLLEDRIRWWCRLALALYLLINLAFLWGVWERLS